MKFSLGIVGLPNVGKSTLFMALTKKQVDTSNYPFCTIDPNVGVVAVPDVRLNQLTEALEPKKVIPTAIEFVDIAGLVAGAHKGEGLGNQFLSHIREVKAIIHLVRDFEDKDVSHVSGVIDSVRDITTIDIELILADLSVVDKKLEAIRSKARSGEKEAKESLSVLDKLKSFLEQEKPARDLILSKEEHEIVMGFNLLTMKPVLYVFNVGEKAITESSQLPVAGAVRICAGLEAELADLPPDEVKEYMRQIGLKELGLNRLIKSSYKLLNLITFFTTQSDILQAWTIERGSTADDAAGIIHTDFQEKFIKVEVIAWQDLVKADSMRKAREAGLVRTEGKNYQVQDGDVLHIKI
jgi:GTP-binding protein YchF